jgi:cysteine sulfinate desulfinase/cysteine desulfurase-like protein
MVEIPIDAQTGLLSTDTILAAINSNETASICFLSAIQYKTGQLLDVDRITSYARERGIIMGWDLSHAVGNVELTLHEWDVDFAVWSCDKYLNAGPGATAGIFIHERHGQVEATPDGHKFRPRLAGVQEYPPSPRSSRCCLLVEDALANGLFSIPTNFWRSGVPDLETFHSGSHCSHRRTLSI